MMSRLFAVAGWLAAGHAVLFGIFWLLLLVPESNVAMLTASALLALVLVALASWIEAVGLLAWRHAGPLRSLARRAVGATPAVLGGALLFALVWWATGLAGSAWASHRTEVDAWLMLHAGWTRTARLHAGVGWVLAFVRYVLGLSFGVGLASAAARGGTRALAGAAWLRRAVSLRRVAVVTASVFLLFWLPWRAVDWRPAWLSPDWQEVAFVSLKLGVLYLVANAGWAVILRESAEG
jgi:hypothetical protein